MAFALRDVPCPYKAVVPYIDGTTIEIHHGKHHAAYGSKLNAAIAEAPSLRGRPLEVLPAQAESLPENVRDEVIDNDAHEMAAWPVIGRAYAT
jgi:Fe-Mn family superoxide dismutase